MSSGLKKLSPHKPPYRQPVTYFVRHMDTLHVQGLGHHAGDDGAGSHAEDAHQLPDGGHQAVRGVHPRVDGGGGCAQQVPVQPRNGWIAIRQLRRWCLFLFFTCTKG